MEKRIDILLKSRERLLSLIAPLTNEQLNKISVGFKNNIVWNVAHLLVTQQIICYKLAGLKCLISNEMIENFQKGTAPKGIVSENEFDLIKQQFLQFPIQLNEDYSNGIFKHYNHYTTSLNVTLTSINDAIDYNLLHEGIHFGIVLQLKKLV